MDVLAIPFNEFIGLKHSDRPEYLLMVEEGKQYLNHLETVHAGVLFALAEASSGYYLVKEFKDIPDIIPVVRKVDVKYRKPAIGKIYSRACFLESGKNEILTTLEQKGRVLIKVDVSLFDSQQLLVMQSVYEWFLTVKV